MRIYENLIFDDIFGLNKIPFQNVVVSRSDIR